jgi:hypothetical protein
MKVWFFSTVEMLSCTEEVVAYSAPLGIEGRDDVMGMMSLL